MTDQPETGHDRLERYMRERAIAAAEHERCNRPQPDFAASLKQATEALEWAMKTDSREHREHDIRNLEAAIIADRNRGNA